MVGIMKVVDGRDKPGHDDLGPSFHLVMPALVAGIHALLRATRQERGWRARRPATTMRVHPSASSCPRLSRASTSLVRAAVKDGPAASTRGSTPARRIAPLPAAHARSGPAP